MSLDESSAPLSYLQLLGRFDRAILIWVASHRPKWLVGVMRVITHTADTWAVSSALALYVVTTASIALWGGSPRLVMGAARATLGVLLSLSIFSFVKRKVSRARPQVHALARVPDRFSMPSGHTATAFASAVGVAFNIGPRYGSVALLWASLVGFSRVVLGVHYPFDVIVGAIIGVGSALVCVAMSMPLI